MKIDHFVCALTNWASFGVRRSRGWALALAALVGAGALPAAAAAPRTDTLVSFVAAPNTPSGRLVQGADGNFYGTHAFGGAFNSGSIFRVTPAGAVTTLVEFTRDGVANRGASPYAGLVLGADGNFYGTTRYGGASGNGTVFRVTPGGALTTLAEFSGNGASNRGSEPCADLVLAADGNFYGTTYRGGAGFGTAFRITPAGALTTLAEFPGGSPNRGTFPAGALVQGTDGNFYGTTYSGGLGYGTIFRMTAGGAVTTLVAFTNGQALGGTFVIGAYPTAGLVQGADGNFYGTTYGGSTNDSGTVFRMTPAGGLTTLFMFGFNGPPSLGSKPIGALVLGADGNFYGNTLYGGAPSYGTIFRITPSGQLSSLVQFTPSQGGNPGAGLTRGTDGNFYGTTTTSGAVGKGTVFRVTPTGEFTKLSDTPTDSPNSSGGRGITPVAGLTLGADGNLYGSTLGGGTLGNGTIFRLTPAGAMSTLLEFTGNDGPVRGASPATALVRGADGQFYGTTAYGGASGSGTIFRLAPAGALTTLVEFTDVAYSDPGAYPGPPSPTVVQGADGNFYGTTPRGGASFTGTIFRLSADGILTTLFEFAGGNLPADGSHPRAALVQGAEGDFYGSTSSGGASGSGTVFRVTPAGALTTLADFPGAFPSPSGTKPTASLALGSDGNFYGSTEGGGAAYGGTIFRISPSGTFTKLVDFNTNGSVNRGAQPMGALLLGTDGNFYGTTERGGMAENGTIFRMTPAGVVTTLVEFNRSGAPYPGANLPAGLTRGADGHLYGVTHRGGAADAGTIFRLRFEPDGSPTQLVSVVVEPGSGTRVRWQATAGQVGRIEYSDDLTTPWLPLAGRVPANGQGVIEYLDPTPPLAGHRYYRLVTPL